MPVDWVAWHRRYESEPAMGSRLSTVRRLIGESLAELAPQPISVLSMCSGDGRDIVAALAAAGLNDGDVSGRLLELDPLLAARARRALRRAGLRRVSVFRRDAGVTTSYVGAVPANLVLACGVFGNVDDGAVERTIAALPMLCLPGASVVWTRHRREPDLTRSMRAWFAQAGFAEAAFRPITDSLATVGRHVFHGQTQALRPGLRLFAFDERDG